MLKVLDKDIKFCDSSVSPLIFLIIIAAVVTVVWALYQGETIDTEDAAESVGRRIKSNPMIAAGNLTPWSAGNTKYAAITKATPKGSYLLIGNTMYGQQQSFKRIIPIVRPSVVNIKATRVAATAAASSPLVDRQVRFVKPYRIVAQANTNDNLYESVGSGIIVSPHGHIITNYHVIANSNKILVTVFGGRKGNYSATIIDHHMETDLTLLKIDDEGFFKPARLGNSSLVEVGDLVLAFGSPFGFDQTVTTGIVSAKRKVLQIGGVQYENMLQTDAPINRGSSGGPLVNLRGEVIGVNTAIYAPTGVFSGAGFAMPINQIKKFLADNNIIIHENLMQVNNPSAQSGRGWFGVEIQPVDRIIADQFGLQDIGGVLVNMVVKNSPASDGGIGRGDIILEFDGMKITDMNTLESILVTLIPGQKIKVLVFRDKKINELYITLSEIPANL